MAICVVRQFEKVQTFHCTVFRALSRSITRREYIGLTRAFPNPNEVKPAALYSIFMTGLAYKIKVEAELKVSADSEQPCPAPALRLKLSLFQRDTQGLCDSGTVSRISFQTVVYMPPLDFNGRTTHRPGSILEQH